MKPMVINVHDCEAIKKKKKKRKKRYFSSLTGFGAAGTRGERWLMDLWGLTVKFIFIGLIAMMTLCLYSSVYFV